GGGQTDGGPIVGPDDGGPIVTPDDGGPVVTHDAGPIPFDAGPAQPCDLPGATEMVPCGNCGTVQRFCTVDGEWVYGVCSGEGECRPGTMEAVSCGNCGTQTARCNTACTWDRTGACAGEGECAPGASM